MLLVCPSPRLTQQGWSLRTIAILLTWVCTFTISASAKAQESAAQGQTLPDLQQQWKTIDQSLDEVQQQLESGDGDSESLRGKYADLVDEANATIEKIRNAAIDQIDSNDGKDMAAIRMLMGILLNAASEGGDAQVLETGDFLIEQGVDPIWFETAAKSQRIPIDAREIFDELLIRQRESAADDLPQVTLTTNRGDIVIELFENQAPETVGNFISLIEADFYQEILFHRVIEGFMAQTGCPEGTGTGGPGYEIECECDSPEARPHFTGSLSMAHAGKDTGGSQFFLTFERTEQLNGRHTAFGRVIDGLDVLEKLQRTHVVINGREEEIPDIEKDQILSAKVIRKRDHVYRPNKAGVDEPPLEELKASEEKQPTKEAKSEDPATEDESRDAESENVDSEPANPTGDSNPEESDQAADGSPAESDDKTDGDSDDQPESSDAGSNDESDE